MTRNDLLQHNVDLIAKAAELFVGEKSIPSRLR